MSKLSKSPERGNRQREMYLHRCQKSGREPDSEYLKLFDGLDTDDDKWKENNMEYDLRSTEWICNKAKASDAYAQNLYAAMCNMQFQKLEVMPILKNELWSCSWRSSGGIVADMREQGDYMDWYCSGMGGVATYDEEADKKYMEAKQYVSEGTVTEEIRQDLKQLGWTPVEWEDDK